MLNPSYMKDGYKHFDDFASTCFPIGTASLAAVLRQHGHEVRALDANALFLDAAETSEKILLEKPEYLCVSSFTCCMDCINATISMVNKQDSSIKVVVGGHHANAFPKRTLLDNEGIDFVVKGEGEETLSILINHLEKNGNKELESIDGIVFRGGNEIIENKNRPFISDLDKLPFPAYDLFPMEKYKVHGWAAWHSGIRTPYGSVVTTRGCPYNCVFCATGLWGHKQRRRRPGNVIKEIDFLVKQYKIKFLSIFDDTFSLNRNHAIEICSLLIERDYGLSIYCSTRADYLDEELLDLMYKAGFRWLGFGIETGNEEILRQTGKKITKAQVEKTLRMAKKRGFYLYLSLIVGHIGETNETFLETVDFTNKYADFATFSVLVPIPGTKVYDFAIKNNMNLPNNWAAYAQFNSLPIPLNENLGEKELQNMVMQAYKKFFIRPAYFYKILVRFKTFIVLKDLIKMFFVTKKLYKE